MLARMAFFSPGRPTKWCSLTYRYPTAVCGSASCTPAQTTCKTPTPPLAEGTAMYACRMLLCPHACIGNVWAAAVSGRIPANRHRPCASALGKRRGPHRKLLPGGEADLEVLAHVQAPDAPLQQHGRQLLQLRVPKALRQRKTTFTPNLTMWVGMENAASAGAQGVAISAGASKAISSQVQQLNPLHVLATLQEPTKRSPTNHRQLQGSKLARTA